MWSCAALAAARIVQDDHIAGGKRRGLNLHDRGFERLAVDRTIKDARHGDLFCMQKFCERPGVGRGLVPDPDVYPVKGQRLSDKRGIWVFPVRI